MNKINIITRHFICNYGSILQSIASQEFFKKYVNDIYIIDYRSKRESSFKNALNGSKKINNKLKGVLYFILRFPDYAISSLIFRKYQKRYLNLTNHINDINRIPVDENTLYCSGSDQLWGFMPYDDIDPAYYLSFAKNAKKIAFSSSFGRLDFDSKREQSIKKYLTDFSLLTLRESSGCDFVKKLGFDKVYNVLDPTMIIDRQYWIDFSKNTKIKEKDYIFVYNLHTNNLLEEVANNISRELDKKIVRVSQHFSAIRLSGKKKIMVSPIKFLKYIMESDCVVTDSFHGFMFSLIFNKNFVIVNPGKTNSRILDFLKILNLEKKFVFNVDDAGQAMVMPNYKIINKKIDDMRKNNIKIFDDYFKNNK